MKKYIKGSLRKHLNEDIDQVLDKISAVGLHNLSELDKIKLATHSNNTELLGKIQLGKLYKENGNSFGDDMIKVKVKPIAQQPINHKISKEYEQEEGYLKPHTNVDDKNNPYVMVKFDRMVQHSPMDIGQDTAPIYLKNLQVVGCK